MQGQRIVIDCMFDDKMNEKEIKSLVQQLGYVYSSNKKSANPANLSITGIGPNVEKQLKKVNYDKWKVPFKNEDYISLYPKDQLVYLTADSSETLTTLDPKCVYIIGGIVDHNRFKMITYKKAAGQGIKTAKLPLDEHINTKSTKVLTVNHVFDCMLKYIECKDWTKAFLTTLPMRKEVTVLTEAEKKEKLEKEKMLKKEEAKTPMVQEKADNKKLA